MTALKRPFHHITWIGTYIVMVKYDRTLLVRLRKTADWRCRYCRGKDEDIFL